MAEAELDLGSTLGSDVEFVYVGDPMCSWCWGFAPVLERLDDRFPIPVRTVMGGLRTGDNAWAMGPQQRDAMGRYWRGVADRTGQEFTPAALRREGWRYDTEPACRAVVAMRQLAPEETLRWLARIHRAFYVEGVDVTDLSVFPSLLGGFDVAADDYRSVLEDPTTLEVTRQDFQQALEYGAAGFPTLLLRDGDEVGSLTRGYVPWEQLEPALTRLITERYDGFDGAMACDPVTGLC